MIDLLTSGVWMIRWFLCLVCLLMPMGLKADDSLVLPQLSPRASVSEVVGTTTVTVDFHRPGVKGRKIWGNPDLVPFGHVWRMGANEATTIRFSDAVKINGAPLAAGTYAIFAIPGPDQWTLVFNRNWRQMGAFDYQAKDDVLRFDVKPKSMSVFSEWLTYAIEPASRSSAYVDLRWERLRISFLVEVDLEALVTPRLKQAIARAGARDWRVFSDAAQYYLEEGRELTQALAWVDRSVRIQENPTNLYVKARILRELGQPPQALAILDKALRLAWKQNAPGSVTGPIQQSMEQWKRIQGLNGNRK